MKTPFIKIISGGQTGVDQAALEAAIKNNLRHGGWCPKGRIAENGVIPDRYHLIETESKDYAERTSLNIGGPRESESPGVNVTSLKFLMAVFQNLRQSQITS